MKVKVVIVMEGGIIQNIITDSEDLSIRLIDWDLDEADPHDEENEEIPYKGSKDKAYVADMAFEYDPAFFKTLKKPMK